MEPAEALQTDPTGEGGASHTRHRRQQFCQTHKHACICTRFTGATIKSDTFCTITCQQEKKILANSDAHCLEEDSALQVTGKNDGRESAAFLRGFLSCPSLDQFLPRHPGEGVAGCPFPYIQSSTIIYTNSSRGRHRKIPSF